MSESVTYRPNVIEVVGKIVAEHAKYVSERNLARK